MIDSKAKENKNKCPNVKLSCNKILRAIREYDINVPISFL